MQARAGSVLLHRGRTPIEEGALGRDLTAIIAPSGRVTPVVLAVDPDNQLRNQISGAAIVVERPDQQRRHRGEDGAVIGGTEEAIRMPPNHGSRRALSGDGAHHAAQMARSPCVTTGAFRGRECLEEQPRKRRFSTAHASVIVPVKSLAEIELRDDVLRDRRLVISTVTAGLGGN